MFVFLCSNALTAFDLEKMEINKLQQCGFKVVIFDLSVLFNRTGSVVSHLDQPYIRLITSYRDLACALQETVHQAVYIDQISGLQSIPWYARKLFAMLKRYGARYYLIVNNPLPVCVQDDHGIWSKIKRFLYSHHAIFDFKSKLLYMLMRWRMKYTQHYLLPEKIFSSDNPILHDYLKQFRLPYSRVVYIHSLAHDQYYTYRQYKKCSLPLPKMFCVFVDQALTHHPDFKLTKHRVINPVTAERYYSSLNHFFNVIENKIALPVIIAGCPRAEQWDATDCFSGRPVFVGHTVELIARSSLVLLHYSTAVSLAVLFDKPILMIKTRQMLHANYCISVLEKMAKILHLKSLCIDDIEAINQADLSNYASWQRQYDDYKYYFVLTKHLNQDKTIWDIVIAEFHKMNGKNNAN